MRRPALLAVLVLAAGVAAVPAVAAPAPPNARRHLSADRPPAARLHASGRFLGADLRSSGGPARTRAASTLDPNTALLPAAGNGTVTVTVAGPPSTVAAGARALGGRVLASVGGSSSVQIGRSRLARLAAAIGVEQVRAPVRAVADAAPVTSQGIHAAGADAWQSAGDAGAGVSVGVVDVGFTGLSAAETAGDLPGDTVVTNEDCTTDSGARSTATSEHGTAVTEIVHEMAPAAHLYLYCVSDTVGFGAAEAAIVSEHPEIKIVSSSLGFPLDSRGDGTGARSGAGITATGVVQKARQAGILWIQSAGNDAEDHWSGGLADADKDGLVDLDGVYDPAKNQYESDAAFLLPGSSAAPSTGQIELQWDQWPTSSSAVTLYAEEYQCTTSFQPDGSCGETYVRSRAVTHARNTAPTAFIPIENTSRYEQYWVIGIEIGTTTYPGVRYDLTYSGDLDGPSQLGCGSLDKNGQCIISARSYQGSISSPATSPYAFAVGAADVGADGSAAGTLEPFSSQGPTIDGRTKPDITAWDGVSSPVYGAASASRATGFYGTSAAAPHVAGAAALVRQVNPGLDAAQVQSFLEQRANSGAPSNPANDRTGHGLLTLGASGAVEPPTGSGYTPIRPTRLLDTRTTTGGHKGRLGAGGTVTVALPSGTPADATAVAVNLTGIDTTSRSNHLTAYPAGTAPPLTSNVNLSRTDRTAAAFAIVSLPSGAAKKIVVRNTSGTVDLAVDELGYFGTGYESGRLTTLGTPKRVLDTRTTIGGHHARIGEHGKVTVRPGVPAGSVAAVVNVTVASPTSSGHISTAPTCTTATSTLNYDTHSRANLALVQLTGSNPGFCLENAGRAVNVVVDVIGYFGPQGSLYIPLSSSRRIVDTRTGNGGSALGHASRPLGAAVTTAFYGANVGDVPAAATALVTGVVEASTTSGSYLSLFPGRVRPTEVSSSLNFSAGRVVANAALVGLSARTFAVFNNAGSTQAAVDLFGYFMPG